MADQHDTGAESGRSAGESPAASDAVGAPKGPGDGSKGENDKYALDPELLALPRPKTYLSPVLAGCVAILCGYLMTQLISDLRFSRADDDPRSVAALSELLDSDHVDQYVRLSATPDRSFVTRVSFSLAEPGSRLAPVQGSDGELWLMIGGSAWTAGIRYDEIYSGRLRQVGDLPFADELIQYVAARGATPRPIQPEVAARALADRATVVRTPGGDTVAVAADTPVHILQTLSDRVRLQTFASDPLTSAEAWAARLAELGFTGVARVADSADATEDSGDQAAARDWWTFEVTVAGGVPAAEDRLRAAQLFATRVSAIEVEHRATWGQLSSAGDSLVHDGQQLPWATVAWLVADVPRQLAPEAMVLITQDRPEDYWYVLPLFSALGLLGLLFIWALVRSLRAARAAAREAADSDPPPAEQALAA